MNAGATKPRLIDLKGVVSLLVQDSLLLGLDKTFDLVVEKLVDKDENTVTWIDDGAVAQYFVLLGRKLSDYASTNNLDRNWIDSALERVEYVECLDLEGVRQQLQTEGNANHSLTVIVNLFELHNSLKLVHFNQSHLLLTDIMLQSRRSVSNGVDNVTLLLNIDDDQQKKIVDFYVDARYRISKNSVLTAMDKI